MPRFNGMMKVGVLSNGPVCPYTRPLATAVFEDFCLVKVHYSGSDIPKAIEYSAIASGGVLGYFFLEEGFDRTSINKNLYSYSGAKCKVCYTDDVEVSHEIWDNVSGYYCNQCSGHYGVGYMYDQLSEVKSLMSDVKLYKLHPRWRWK